jgi:colicin import membrane protein
MNLITSGVMRAMTGAASSAGLAGVSMGVYRAARAKGDEAGMARAAGYAAGSMQDADEARQSARRALEQAQAEARKQEAQARRAAEEDARTEARAEHRDAADARPERQQAESAQPEHPLAAQKPGAAGESAAGEDSGQAQSTSAAPVRYETGLRRVSTRVNSPIVPAPASEPKGSLHVTA